MNLDPKDRLMIVGKTGTGKSTLAKELCGLWMKRHRVVCFDVCDEYSQKGRRSREVRLGPLRERVTLEQLHKKLELLDDPNLALSVVPSDDEEECARDFEDLAELVKHTGDLVFIVEEVGFFGELAAARINQVATMFRHYGVAVVFVAQCAVQVPKKARRQLSALVSFRQDDPDDLSALESLAGETFAERVSRLAAGEHADWRDSLKKPPTVGVAS